MTSPFQVGRSLRIHCPGRYWRRGRSHVARSSSDGKKRRISAQLYHYIDVVMVAIASQITSLIIVNSTVDSGADQRKHQSSASLAFVWGIHRWPVHSPHKWPVTRKMFPFDDVIMWIEQWSSIIKWSIFSKITNSRSYRSLESVK